MFEDIPGQNAEGRFRGGQVSKTSQPDQGHGESHRHSEKKHEEKIGREILDEHRKRRIEFFREDIEDAIAVLEPVAQKHKISHEVYWDAVIRIATTLHIGSTKRGRI